MGSRVIHGALHKYTIGLNASVNAGAARNLPFPSALQQGWKEYYHVLNQGAVLADDAYWEINAFGSGTVGPGDSNSIVFTAATTTDNTGYEIRQDIADVQVGGATKKFFLETIVKLTHASGTVAANEWFVGWTNDAQATASDGATWAFADGFGFGQLDAGEPVFVTNTSNSEQSEAMSGALTTAVYKKFSCYFDGVSYNLYEDDVSVKSVTASPVSEANVPLTMNVMFKVGEAKTNTLNIKYAYLAVEL